MRRTLLGLFLASTVSAPALANNENAESVGTSEDAQIASSSSAPTDGAPAAPAKKAFTTGVAKGRDMLDTAISASILSEEELALLSVSSASGVLQNIPGFRSENDDTPGFSAITIRGLPLATEGSRWVQIQEDGLPVLELADFRAANADRWVRTDLTTAQVQSIRGGSASTFASNSPGGVVNFLSRNGDVAGGSLQLSGGLDHELNRLDFAYGSPIGENWNFHIGGFYRLGEGPRTFGYNAFKGGQIKANVTRNFENGYVRLYFKHLNDRTPTNNWVPVALSGTDDAPVVANPGNFNILDDSIQTRLNQSYPDVDENNQLFVNRGVDGTVAKSTSIGLEAKFDVAGWSVRNRFRFSSNSGSLRGGAPLVSLPANVLAGLVGGPGAQLTFSGGPNQGANVPDDTVVSLTAFLADASNNSFDNVTNELRASRVWEVGPGRLTTTAGLYLSSQEIDIFSSYTSRLNNVAGNAGSVPLDLTTAGGAPITDQGVLAYGLAIGVPIDFLHLRNNYSYDVLAPFGSVNFMTGKLALGASIRWDRGNVQGRAFSPGFASPAFPPQSFDVNSDGQISTPEMAVPFLPLSQPASVDFDYDYLSYSVSANYRIARELSVFGRYSRGGTVSNAEVIAAGSLDPATGELLNPDRAFSRVDQAEVGVKYRTSDLELYLTGFWASTSEINRQITPDPVTGLLELSDIVRDYGAKGIELEGSYSTGPFSIALGATYSDASIEDDEFNQNIVGNTPRHIPDLQFFARPQIEVGPVNFGAVINGTTESFAQDTNLLTQPSYVLVSPFFQYKAQENLTIGLNAFNVFNEVAVVQLLANSVADGPFATAQIMNGRTVTASVRYNF